MLYLCIVITNGRLATREARHRVSKTTKKHTTIMAKILYEVKQNMNTASKTYGKWYGRAKALETMNTRKLAQHIAEHGNIYTSDVVFGVLEKFRSCLVEMLLNSKKVKIDGLGTFYTTLESSGANSKEKYSVQENVKGLHIRFLPGQEQEMDLSSRQFLKKAEFISIDQLKPDPEQEEGGGGDDGDETEP